MTKNNIFIRNLSPERSVIDIEGTIGVDENLQFNNPGSRVATYEKLTDALLRISEIETPEVVVNIRSTGGDVNDALLIYEALKSLPGRVITCCYGYTASAATVIAQAASAGCRRIASGALYLIHNSICATEGNASELEASTDLLRKTDERLAALYAERSGAPVDSFIALMAENNGAGRWLSPAEAVEAGLADEVIDDPHREDSDNGKKSAAAEKKEAAANNRAGSCIEEVSAYKTGTAAKSVTRAAAETAEDFRATETAENSQAAETAENSRATGGGREVPDIFRFGKANLEAADKDAGACFSAEAGTETDPRNAAKAGTRTAAGCAEKTVARETGKAAKKAAAQPIEEEIGKETEKETGKKREHFATYPDERSVTGWRTLIRHLQKLFAGWNQDAAETAKTAAKAEAGTAQRAKTAETVRMTEVRGEGFKRVTPPVDKNIFHTEDPDPLREMIRSRIAFSRGQSSVQPTATQPVEDPAAYEYSCSANERAYAEDARRMRL